jgi:hypothetical protein
MDFDDSPPWIRKAHLLAFLPAAVLALVFVRLRFLNIPVGDQWYDPVNIVVKASTNQLSWRDLFALAEGHRPLMIRLFALAGTLLFKLDPALMSLATWLVSLINLSVIYSLFRGDLLAQKTRRKSYSLLCLLCLSSVVFVIHDQQGWIDYYFATWQLSLCFFLCACLCLQRLSGWNAFAGAAIFCLASTFSLGIGLASWLAIPVVAIGYRNWRKIQFLVAWTALSVATLYAYQSSFANPLNEASGSQRIQGFSTLLDSNSWVTLIGMLAKIPLLFLSRLWIPATVWDGTAAPKIIIFFSMISILLFAALIAWLCSIRCLQTASTWLGIATYSFLGAGLVFLSRHKFMPELRHGAGANSFWMALIVVSTLYLARAATPQRLPAEFSQQASRGAVRGTLFILACGALVFVPILSLAKTITEFRLPNRFPKECTQITTHYFLLRDKSLRSCFEFIDERSVYQLSLLDLANLGTKGLGLPQLDSSATIITLLPGKLLSAFVGEALVSPRLFSSSAQSSHANLIAFAAGEETRPQSGYNPFKQSMDWSGRGRLYKPALFSESLPSILTDLRARTFDQNPIYLIDSSETQSDAAQVLRLLQDQGLSLAKELTLRSPKEDTHFLRLRCLQPPSPNRPSLSTAAVQLWAKDRCWSFSSS